MREFLDYIRSYSVADFIPIAPQAYLSLLERVNAFVWPWQFLTLLIGFVVLVLIWRGREKLVWPLLGVSWITVGVCFHGLFFVELNWAAIYFAWGFVIQGSLLLLVSVILGSAAVTNPIDWGEPRRWFGLLSIVCGVLVFPLLPMVFDHSAWSGEYFAIAPDPTCLVTLGVFMLSPRTRWWLVPLPLLWAVFSGAMASVLNFSGGVIVLLFAALYLSLLMFSYVSKRLPYQNQKN